MYSAIVFMEKVLKYIRIHLKILYWKTKYGNRIKIGKNFKFRKSLIINISKQGKIVIGDNCFFNNYCSINCHESIKIGNDNIFGENVKIYDHNHIFNDKSLDMKTNFKCGKIRIGNNNWFGSNSVILSKASIENDNVFGANTIINNEYGSGIIIKNVQETKMEKIRYKVK